MSKRLAERLDWNQMLGFEQVVDDREALRVAGNARLGSKVGEKPGVKSITRGHTIGAKIGAKVGSKV